MSETPEEKAREYIDDVIGNYHYVGWDKEEAIMELNNAYLVSYHSRNEEVNELREALKEIIDQFEYIERSYTKDDPSDLYHAVNNGMISIHEFKAKQLLNNKP